MHIKYPLHIHIKYTLHMHIKYSQTLTSKSRPYSRIELPTALSNEPLTEIYTEQLAETYSHLELSMQDLASTDNVYAFFMCDNGEAGTVSPASVSPSLQGKKSLYI